MTLVVRAARRADAETLFRWLNAPDRQVASFQTGKSVLWQDHVDWLERQLANPDCWQAIAFRDEQPAGQVRIERQGEALTVSIYVDAGARGLGIGRALIDRACEAAHARWPGLPVVAHIRADNPRSVAFFKGNGFQDEASSGDRITLRRN